MEWIGLGKFAVTTHTTPRPLSSSQVKCNTVIFTFDPADTTATVYIKDKNGNIMAALSTSGGINPLIFTGPGQNTQDLRDFQIDASADGKGPFVSYGVA